MRDYLPLPVAVLLVFGAGLLARYGWLEKDQGYFFLGAVILVVALVAVLKVALNIVRGRLRSGE